MATVVHTNADGTTHTHGPTSAKIVALGTVTLGGATFMIDRDGQIEAGKTTEFGIEHVGGGDAAGGEAAGGEATAKRQRTSAVVPTGAWLVNPDGKKLCEPVSGEGHDTADGEGHWHMNVQPLYPVKKSKFVLQVGTEEAVVDFARGAAPCNDGILSVFKQAEPEWRGFLELKLHGDAGDLELWLYTSAGQQSWGQSHTGKPVPFDIPKETVIRLTFPRHAGKTLEMRVRNGEKNEDEEGAPNLRGDGTNYFIFPGESGQDQEWLKGEEWRGITTVAFEANGKSFSCDPFVLVPHEAL